MDGTGGAGTNAGLLGQAYAPLGQYFAKFVQAYAAQGVPVRAVTPQNEPLNGAAAYPGMDLDQPSELSLIAKDMGPALHAAGLATQIWAYDHNWDVESYPAAIMADATAGGFTEGAAFHCYGGDPSAMTTFHEAYPQKSVYMTECSGGTWQSDPFASTIDLAIASTANWARVVSLWNMALDEAAGPQNHGCSTCRGVVTVDSASGAVTYEADYWALGHFAKFVRPGASRVASTSTSAALSQVAFANTDGRLAVVAHNTGASALTVRVGTGATAMTFVLPADAAVTVAWTP
jgi:glucosylceramidase